MLLDSVSRHAPPHHAHDRQRSRTRAGRAANRAVTFVARQQSLPRAARQRRASSQLTDVQPRKRDPRDTDSQKFIKDEEQKLIEHTRVEAEKKKKAEEKDKARALPKFELADRQTATDLQLSPDGKHVFIADRRARRGGEAAQRAELRHRVELHGRHPGAHVRRRRAGQAHAGGDESGDGQDGRERMQAFAGTVASQAGRRTARRSRARCAGACRSCPTTARSRSRTCAPTTTKIAGWSPSIPRRARRRVLDTLHDDAWVREVGGFGADDPSFGWLPDQKHVWFLSERDGWMHLYTRRRQLPSAASRAAADAGQVGDRRRSACRPTARSSTSPAPRSIRASGTSTRCRSTAARARS